MCPLPLEMNQFTDEKEFIMKRTFCFFILIFTVCFVCEKRPALAADIPPCLTIHPDPILPEPAPLENDDGEVAHRVARGVVIKSAIWKHSETVANETDSTLILRVRFLGGTDDEMTLVRQVAPEWSKYADVRFEFVESDPSDIRVGFDPGGGNWSSLGKFAIGKNKTMNLALRGMRESRKQGVILHEFGHALGLHHEHKSPTLPFEWNEDVIIEEIMRVWKWTKDRIRLNILDKLSETQTNFTEFDPHSIMIYPIPNRWTIGDFEIDYATVLSEMDKQFIGEIYGVARPLNGRSPRVRDAIVAAVPGVNNAADVTAVDLAQIKTLIVNDIGDSFDGTYLKSDDFDGLTNLTRLELRYKYGYWAVYLLPKGIFEGLTSLKTLVSASNRRFLVALRKVGTDQFKAVAPAGAPFDIVLPLVVANGTINGGATSITIPKGSVESTPLTVTRTPGSKSAVYVDIEQFPSLPDGHEGYFFVRESADLSFILKIFDALPGAPTPIHKRTPQVIEAIVKAVPEIETPDLGKKWIVYLAPFTYEDTITYNHYGALISDAQLEAITSLDLSNAKLRELKPEDFEGLTNLTKLNLSFNKLSSLPRGIFDKLTNLTVLELGANELSSLIPTVLGIPDIPIFRKPSDIFDELTNLKTLELAGNELSSLPSGVLDELTNLTRLDLGGNNLSSLPSGIFGELTNLTSLSIGGNELSSLQSDIFDELTTLTSLNLEGNKFGSLPAGIFDNTTNLIGLQLSENQLSTLPVGIFDNTTNLIILALGGNQLNALPASIFSQLTNLIVLDLTDNQLSTLPAGIFEGLSNIDAQAVLAALNTGLDNPLDSLPQELSSLTILLSGNPVDPLPLTVSLEKIRIDGFKAVVPTGAPFDIVLPITVTNGSISGGATSLTIPKGSLQSEALTVTRAAGTTATVTVDIGNPLQGLPDRHSGYALVKSGTLPLTFVQLDRSVFTPVSDRTPEVRDAIVKTVPGIDSATDVTAAHLAAITSMSIELSNSIKIGDFDGLTGLTSLGLTTEELTSLPAGLFKDLSNVTYMEWYSEKLSTLPVGTFEGLTNLETFGWGARGLTSLPAGVFAPLTDLTTFEIAAPQLNKLPANMFDRLTNLTYLSLYAGRLRILPDSIFDQLTQLKTLTLASDQLTSLPDGIFDRLTQLTSLRISRTQLTNLPDGLFSGLSSLTSLRLDGNAVDPLPFTVSLEKVGAGQFKAVASTGAPFDLILPINVTNGSINSGITTLTIPTGSVESGILTVSHTPNAIEAVAVDIGTLPGLPTTVRNGTRLHTGYTLTKSIDLPLEFGELGGRVFTPVSERTPQVRDKIVEAVPGVNSAADITKAHLAAITGLGLGLNPLVAFGGTAGEEITSLQTGDFDGLTGMTTLWIGGGEQLRNVPAGIFKELTALETLNLTGNFSSLPNGVFDGLTALTFLSVASLPLESLPAGVFDDLTALTTLIVWSARLESLPAGVFDQLTALTKLAVSGPFDSLPADIFSKLTSLTLLGLGVDETLTLPAGTFEGLTTLTDLSIARADYSQVDLQNPESLDNIVVDEPLPLIVSLEKVGTDQFKTVAPTGAPFEMVLPLTVTNGSINGVTRTTITIPAGSVESNTLMVKRIRGTTAAVTLNIGTLPELPTDHEGYTLVKSDDLPLEFTTGLETEIMPVRQRTPQVRDAIIRAARVNSAADVTDAHLAAITQLNLISKNITSLKSGDFDGLTAMTWLRLNGNPLTSLPAGVFSGLSSLTTLSLHDTYKLTSLPADVFSRLSSLTTLELNNNKLASLPEDVFSGLTSLESLWLSSNALTDLPKDVFKGLTSLTTLYLTHNDLTGLRADVFSGLTSLTTLWLYNNKLTSLPKGAFSGLTSLESLKVSYNRLTNLPDNIFEGLTSLTTLSLSGNAVDPFSFTVSLKKVGPDQFKAVAPAGAPFAIVLPLTVTNGSITGGATSITIPVGSLESGALTVTRTAGTTAAVRVNIGTLPGLPTNHTGYTLVKSAGLPLEIITGTNNVPVFTDGTSTTRTIAENTAANTNIGTPITATDTDSGDTLTYTLSGTDAASFGIVSTTGQLQTKAALDYETKTSYTVTVSVSDGNGGSDSITVTINVTDVNETIIDPPLSERTSQVRDAIVREAGVNSADDVTEADLVGIWQLDLESKSITALKVGDFNGLTSLRTLSIRDNQLTTLPADIFDGLTALTTLNLEDNQLSTLPVDILADLTELLYLTLADNQLTTLPAGIFEGPSALRDLWLDGNRFTTLPVGIFKSESVASGFNSLRRLYLEDNTVDPLPLTLSLEKVADGQFKAVAPTGAAFKMVLPISVTNGSINGGATTLTIPKGHVESETLTVTRTAGTTAAVTVDLGTLPSLPQSHEGYVLRKSVDLPLKIISGTNTAPVFTDGTSTTRSIAENTAANTNIGTAIAATDADTGDTLTYTLSGTDAASFSIVSTTGQLQTNAGLDYETKASYAVTVSVSDGNGGSGSIDVTINITDANDAPVFSQGNTITVTTVLAPKGNTEGDYDIGDPLFATDADGDSVTYSLSGTDANLFNTYRFGKTVNGQIQSHVQLTTRGWSLHDANKSSFTVIVTASDRNGGSDSITVTINVVAETANNAPVFTDGTSTTRIVAENTAANTNIGAAIAATDADTGDTLTYTLGGTDVASFSIVSTSGQLQTKAALDYETKTTYTVTISVSDGNGGTDSITVTINVTDVNENSAPAFTEGTTTTRTVAENIDADTTVTAAATAADTKTTTSAASVNIGSAVSATDADNDTLTYTLSGRDAAAFTIDSTTGQLKAKAALDYETKSTYTVTVSVSDGSLSDTITVTINVTDLNELSTTPAICQVGDVIAPGESCTYPGTDTEFSVNNSGIGQFLFFTAGNNLNIKNTKLNGVSYTLVAKKLASGSWEIEEVADKAIARPNTAPVFTDGTSTTRSVAENTAANTNIGTAIAATDTDTADTLTYTLSGTDAASFGIVSTTGQLQTRAALDYETKPSYSVTVSVSDGNGGSDSITVTINVTNVNEIPANNAPVFTEGTSTTRSVAENTGSGVTISTAVSATDADNDILTYSLSGTDAASFGIVSTTGQLQTNAALDYETKNTYRVTVSVSDGTLRDTISVTINVIDVNDTVITLGVVSVANRTPEVRDAIVAAVPNVNNAASVTAAHLAAITGLNLRNAGITALKIGDFSGMTALTSINLFNNQLSSLPPSIFAGLTSLTTIRLGRNTIDPFPLIVSLEKVGDGVFKAVAPAGATFNYVLPITVTNGTINGGVTTLTIPHGNMESGTLTLTRTPGTTGHVMVDIGAFPGLPRTHYGYALTKSDYLPLAVIRGINTAPVFSDGTTVTRSIAENTAPNTNIGTPITATDVDNDRLTYTLSGTHAAAFGIDSTTGQLRTQAALDYETKTSYAVTVAVSDGYGGSNRISVTINVTDIRENRAPVFTDGTATTRTVAENTATNTNIGTAIAATDADNDTLTYTLRGTDAAAFRIVNTTGQLRTRAALDYETKTSYAVTISVSDGNGGIDSITVTINVTDVNENRAPVFTDGTSTTRAVAENTATNTNIGTAITATDADGDTLTYTLSGTDAAAFGINSTTGQLRTKAALDYETKTSYAVIVSVSDGSLTDTITVTINITDLDDTRVVSGVTPVSQRTPQVRDAIVAAVPGVNSAANVTEAHLARITTLNLRAKRISALKAGDFDGLSALREIELAENQLRTLPTDIFSGLSSLRYLYLNQNQLTLLPEKLFDGLTSLEHLYLNQNQLIRLPEKIFNGLVSIRQINLHTNKLTRLPPKVFSGLPALLEIFLRNNQLTEIPADVFSGLPLIHLYLDRNRLTDLPADVFSGLSSLTSLLLNNNQMSTLPTGVFRGLTASTRLWLHGNTVDPLPLIVSLEKVGTNQFKAVVPAGAPFRITLPLSVANGSISSGATTLTIPQGSVESGTLAVTRTVGTTAAVTVDIGTLPRLPANHQGYKPTKSTNLPRTIISSPGNRAPMFTEGTNTTRTIAENTARGIHIGPAVTATDADNDTLTYSLGGTDAATFGIDATTGQLKTEAALDYETKTTYTVTVTVSDGSLTDTITVTINITDVAELPTTTAICRVGDVLAPGESCTYPDTDAVFSVRDDGSAQWNIPNFPWLNQVALGGSMSFTADINNENYHFVAKEVSNNSWEIEEIGDDTKQQPETPEQPGDTGGILTLRASTAAPLTEAILHEGIVTLTLSGGTYERSNWRIRDAVSVSGITGIALDTFDTERISDTKITVKLEFDGNINTDTTLTITVKKGAIVDYDGAALTAQIPVTAASESISASTAAPLTEATLDESVITLTLSGRKFERRNSTIRGAVSVSGISGITVRRSDIDRQSDTEVTVELTFNGNLNADSTLTLTVGADAIAGYNGPALMAQVSVAAGTEAPVEPETPEVPEQPVETQTPIESDYDYIEGPWLWMIAPGGDIDIDNLSEASEGVITEAQIAQTGVNEGDHFNDLQWTSGRLLPTTVCGIFLCSSDNVINVVREIGLTDNVQLSYYSAYALINIFSPRAQNNVLMGVGSDDSIKVWLNGSVAYENDVSRRTTGIQNQFPVNLNAGNNLLLIKVCNHAGLGFNNDWGMFFKLYLDTQDYTLSLPTGSTGGQQPQTPQQPQQPVNTGGTPTLSVSTVVPLTEATLHGGVITLNLSSGIFESSSFRIRNAVSVSGINGATVDTFSVDRVGDTKYTVELEYDGNMTANGTLTVSVGAGAIKDYNGASLTSQIAIPAVTESVTASTAAPLTEATLDESIITLTLNGRKFERRNSTIRRAVSVSGISGVTVRSSDIDRQNDTEVTVELTFNGNLNADSTLTLTVGPDAIAGYNGPELTAQVSVSAGDTPKDTGGQNPQTPQQPGNQGTPQQPVNTGGTTLSVSTATPLTEAMLHGGVITLNLSGATFERSMFWIRNAISVSGITGVDVESFGGERISDTQATIELEYEGNMTANGTLTISLEADGIKDYDGATLTAQIQVTTVSKSVAASTASPLTEATLDESIVTLTLTGAKYENFIFDIRGNVTVSGITGVTIPWNQPKRKSDTEITIELEFDGDMTRDGTLTFTVDADAIAGYNGPALTDQVTVSASTDAPADTANQNPAPPETPQQPGNQDPPQQPGNTGGTPTLTTSTSSPLTEATLHESVVTLTLSGGTYERSRWDIEDAVFVSGISGVTFDNFFGLKRVSDTKITVELEFAGNMDTNGTLTFTVGADAIAGYSGTALTAQVTVTAMAESVAASSTSPLKEATLDGSTVTLTLSGRKFERFIFDIQDAVSVSGIAGVTIPWHQPKRKSDTEITIELEFDGDMTTDGTLTFTVGADAIAGYNGAALTAQITVTADRENALLANFPNPFNPETWIPYHLAEPAEVNITIYAINGQVVRRLELEHQPAGTYQTRSRAAYWDGKNAFGEPVASGVYFYTLTAGDFTATRKMLIRK